MYKYTSGLSFSWISWGVGGEGRVELFSCFSSNGGGGISNILEDDGNMHGSSPLTDINWGRVDGVDIIVTGGGGKRDNAL